MKHCDLGAEVFGGGKISSFKKGKVKLKIKQLSDKSSPDFIRPLLDEIMSVSTSALPHRLSFIDF